VDHDARCLKGNPYELNPVIVSQHEPPNPRPWEIPEKTPVNHIGNPNLTDAQIEIHRHQRKTHPWWNAKTLSLGRVQRRNPKNHTIDVVMATGGLIKGVKVLGNFGASAGSQYILPQTASVTASSNAYEEGAAYPVPGTDDLYAIIGFLGNQTQQPICLGFLPPLQSQMFLSTEGARLDLHESGVYRVTLPDWHDEMHWPDGTYLIVGSDTTPHDMTTENPGWKPNTEVTGSVTLHHASGAEIQIDPVGQVSVSSAAGEKTLIDGSPAGNAPHVADAQPTLLTTTNATTVISYTPTAQGNYVVRVYLQVITAATTVTVQVTYADSVGAQTNPVLNAQSCAVDSYSLPPVYFNAVSGTAIAVVVTAGTASQVYVSADISQA